MIELEHEKAQAGPQAKSADAQKRVDTCEKWRALRKTHGQLTSSKTRIPYLTPFYGSPLLEQFTPAEKDRLYRYFQMLHAEAFITLE